jgi:hypothetical protein
MFVPPGCSLTPGACGAETGACFAHVRPPELKVAVSAFCPAEARVSVGVSDDCAKACSRVSKSEV